MIKKYYTLETILEAIDMSKEKFVQSPYMQAGTDRDEVLLLVDGFLASLMREVIMSESVFLNLEELNSKGDSGKNEEATVKNVSDDEGLKEE